MIAETTCDMTGSLRHPADGGTAPVRPLFRAAWLNALFLHYEIQPSALQPFVPFELDLWRGRAFISLVAFTMRGMRFARGGALGAWLCRPIATHEFLNLRTYVRHGDDTGICFLSEWLPNRLSLVCGPLLYSLPYRHGKIDYCRDGTELTGSVVTRHGALRYEATISEPGWAECIPGSLDEFLLERYAAFNGKSGARLRRMFRVAHEPWPQRRAKARVLDDSLLRHHAPWWPEARLVGANFSPGVHQVAMSAPSVVRSGQSDRSKGLDRSSL